MIKFFKKIYLSKTVFLVLIAELTSLLPLSILMFTMSNQMTIFYGFVYSASIILFISLFFAYRRHDLILMNGLISAIMILEILRYAFVIGSYIQMGTEAVVSKGFMACLELELKCFAFFIELFIAYNHYTLNTKHGNNLTKIVVNQFSLLVLGFVFMGIIVVNWRAHTDPWILLSNSLLYLCDILLYAAIACCELVLSVDRINNTMNRGNPKDIKGALWYLITLFCGSYGLIIALLLKGLPQIFVIGDVVLTLVCAGGLFYYLNRKNESETPAIRFGRIIIFLVSLGTIVALVGFFVQTIGQFHKEIRVDATGDISSLDMKAVEEAENCYVFETNDLYILFPQYKKVDFVFEDCPSMKEDDNLTYFATSAFFRVAETDFHHENIVGDHACDGVYYKGAEEEGLSAFTFYNNEAHFVLDDPDDAVKLAADNGGSGFEQFMAIYNGEDQQIQSSKLRCYRVLAKLNGKVCMIESTNPTHYKDFIQSVLNIGVKEALYVDMGGKSSYSQYRNNNGKAVNLFAAQPGPYVHSWVVFEK